MPSGLAVTAALRKVMMDGMSAGGIDSATAMTKAMAEAEKGLRSASTEIATLRQLLDHWELDTEMPRDVAKVLGRELQRVFFAIGRLQSSAGLTLR